MNEQAAKLKPNTTQIPNILLDEWLGDLTPAEFKVVMVIARQTYGWHKESDRIAYSQLVKKTSYSKDTLTIAVKSLRANGRIIVTDSDGNQLHTIEECRGKSLYYKLNLDHVGKSDKSSVNVSENTSRKIRHTKETNTKLSISKDITKGDKSPKEYGNPLGKRILKEFREVSGLERSADRYPERVAWNFIQRYGQQGVDNFMPCMVYLQDLWKKDITKIETVKLHYPTFKKDVLKESIITHELSEDEKAMATLLRRTP